MKTFDELWDDILERCERFQFPLVQDKEELRHVFNLVQDSRGYLEIGTAEGNSLYVLANNIRGKIFSVDFGEVHTKAPRDEIFDKLAAEYREIIFRACNSHSYESLDQMHNYFTKYDTIMIDAGHTYEDVIADACSFGWLAKRYIFFHDIQLPPVKAAFEWYCAQNPQFKNVSTFINSPNYGYGIVEI